MSRPQHTIADRLPIRTTSARPHAAAIIVLIWCGLVAPAAAQESLAKHVPADAAFFVEMRDSSDLLIALTDPQIWTTLAEFAGQPADADEAAEWSKRIQRTVKMSPVEAIRTLLSEQVAYAVEDPRRSQDGVMLCRPRGVSIDSLMEKWRPRAANVPPPPFHELPGAIGLARDKDVLVFGDAAPPEGMFRRTAALASNSAGKRLFDDPLFRGLLERIPGRPDGLLFARGAAAAASRPASRPATAGRSATPLNAVLAAIQSADGWMLALHRESPRLHISAVATARDWRVASPPRQIERRFIPHLPAATLVAWEGRVDYASFAGSMQALPQRSSLRDVLGSDLLAAFVEQLDGQTCIALGAPGEANAAAGQAPPFPAFALLCRVRNADAAEWELNRLIDAGIAAGNVALLKKGREPLPQSSNEDIDGAFASFLDLSSLVTNAAIREAVRIELAWAVVDDTLIVATSGSWLRAILAARRADRPPLAGLLDVSRQKIAPTAPDVVGVQTQHIARLGDAWISYLQATAPQVMTEEYWRRRQPAPGGVQLGIDVREENGALIVKNVIAGRPADGRLRLGDRIIGYEGKRFATTQPVQELRDGLEKRESGGRFDVLIERGAARMVASLPLPFVDPIQTLRRIVAIGGLARRVVFHDDASDPAGPRGFLTIELGELKPPATASSPAP